MRNVIKIVNLFGGVGKFPALKIERPNYMRLCIEQIGVGPRGYPLISVAHYFEQNGDLCRDPDMTFEWVKAGSTLPGCREPVKQDELHPVSFQQDIPPVMREAVYEEGGRVLVKMRMLADIKSFATIWDRNLGEQGFVTEAEAMARAATKAPA